MYSPVEILVLNEKKMNREFTIIFFSHAKILPWYESFSSSEPGSSDGSNSRFNIGLIYSDEGELIIMLQLIDKQLTDTSLTNR